jgi:hypothetical protein
MEVRSSGSPKGNPDRFLAGLPLKIFHNRDIVEAEKTSLTSPSMISAC